MTLVVLAAGMGSRFGGLKQITPITDNGEFIIDFSIYDAVKSGFDRVVFVIKRENYDAFVETVGKRIAGNINVEYAFQEQDDIPSFYNVNPERTKPWGTAHATLAARHIVNDNFAVINADDFYGRAAFEQLAKHLKDAKSVNGVSESCMVGYVLKNTLTENGSVSRGECFVDENGMLTGVTERTKIERDGNGARYLDDDGSWKSISPETIASMNCWGFTPDVFAHIEHGFENFLRHTGYDEIKKEYYLPFAVEEMMNAGKCTVKVYKSESTWYGVTYAQDKEFVYNSIKALIDSGEYPEKLWEN